MTDTASAPTTRKDLLARLDDLGWQGPRSYTAADLRDLLIPWVAAGCPKDGPAPAGALAFKYPVERTPKVRSNKTYAKGYQQALADVAALPTLKAVKEFLLANMTAEASEASDTEGAA